MTILLTCNTTLRCSSPTQRKSGEEGYAFTTIEQLLADFEKDVDDWG